MKQLTITLFLTLYTIVGYSQGAGVLGKKNAVSFSAMGITPLAGFIYERAFSNYFIAELGVGYVSGGVGLKYYPFKIKAQVILPYVSASVSVSPLYGDCELCVGGNGVLGYFPVGLSFFGKRGLNISLNGGLATVFEDDKFLYGGLSIGRWF